MTADGKIGCCCNGCCYSPSSTKTISIAISGFSAKGCWEYGGNYVDDSLSGVNGIYSVSVATTGTTIEIGYWNRIIYEGAGCSGVVKGGYGESITMGVTISTSSISVTIYAQEGPISSYVFDCKTMAQISGSGGTFPIIAGSVTISCS